MTGGRSALAAKVRTLGPSMTRSMQRVAEAVASDPAGCARLTVTALAQRTGTSEDTVVRTARILGYPGYRDLRLALAAFAAQQEAGAPASVTADLTLYAQWEANVVTLDLAVSTVRPGDTLDITATGLDPHESVEIWLNSTPVSLLVGSADASGSFTATVTIPTTVLPGEHQIEARGALSGSTFADIAVVAAEDTA